MPPLTAWLAASCALESALQVATQAAMTIARITGGPATPAAIGDKIADCLGKYRRDGGAAPSASAFRRDLRTRLHLPPLREASAPDGQKNHARQDKPVKEMSSADQTPSERTV